MTSFMDLVRDPATVQAAIDAVYASTVDLRAQREEVNGSVEAKTNKSGARELSEKIRVIEAALPDLVVELKLAQKKAGNTVTSVEVVPAGVK